MAVTRDGAGVMKPIPTDMCLIGDTRHELHYKPLPKRGPVIGPEHPSSPEGDSRYDQGSGTGEGGELKGY